VAKGKSKPKAKPAKAAAKKAAPKKPLKKPAKKLAKKPAAPKKAKAAAKASSKQTASKPKMTPTRSQSTHKPTMKMSGKFVPLEDRVLVEPSGPAERTAGGLFIPDMVKERPSQGRVMAIGQGARKKKGGRRPMDVKVGDEVLFATHAGTQLKIDNREMLLLREDEILAVTVK